MPESDITTWDARRWQRLPVTATQFFQCQQIGVHGSAAGTTAQVHRSDHALHVRFTCPLKHPPATCVPQKPVGDPDIYRNGEYVRVVMRRGSMKEQVHWTVTLDGQAISEFGDRRINDPASWDHQVQRHDDHWSATLHLPLDALGPQAPEALRFYLMRCTPDEGITSWPTPFGTWLHAHDQAFVPLDFAPHTPQALVSRCHDLYREVYEVCHSFPDDAPDWHTRMAGLLAPGVCVDQCAHHVHARSSQWPKRHFMHLLDRADPMAIDPARIHEALDAQDHDDRDTLARIAREWKTELLTRGEAMMMGAYVYRLGGNEHIARRVRESLALFIQRYPLSCGLQRLSPDGKWGSSLNIYTLGLANRAMYLLSSRAQQDNDLLLALLKRTHEVIHQTQDTATITVHRRIITQLDRFICVIDHITGTGQHNIHCRLQLPRGQVVLEGNRFRTTTGQIDLAGMHLDDVPFEQDAGDWSGGPDQQVTLRWTRAQASLPLTQAVLLIPFEQGQLSMPRINAMTLSADTCHLELCWPDGEKSILNWP